MRFDEYRAHDAVGLAALVRKGEVTAGELLDAALARTAEVNPKINAVTRDMSGLARKAPAGEGPCSHSCSPRAYVRKGVPCSLSGFRQGTTAGSA